MNKKSVFVFFCLSCFLLINNSLFAKSNSKKDLKNLEKENSSKIEKSKKNDFQNLPIESEIKTKSESEIKTEIVPTKDALQAAEKNKNVLQSQNIFVEYSDLNGSVFIYYKTNSGKKIPVIDPIEYARSTFIGLAVDKTYINLRDSISSNYQLVKKSNSLTVEYALNNKINFAITYSILPKNVLSIKYTLSNLDSKNHSLAFKSVFDTILSERSNLPFMTAENRKINSEFVIEDLKKHKFLTSSDGRTKIDFILDDEISADVYKVVIAAKPYLNLNSIDTIFSEGRGFDTVLSYNNSSVGFFYKTLVFPPEAKKTFEQKIIFSSTEDLENSLKNKDDENKVVDYDAFEYLNPESAKKNSQDKTEISKNEFDNKNLFESDLKNENNLVEENLEISVVEQKNGNKNNSEKQNFSKSNKKINRQYALELINRIQQLKDDGSDVSREEITKLQIELDKILRALEGDK